MKHRLFFIFTAILLAFSTFQTNATDRTIKILAIGNSFSVDAVEQDVWELFNAEGINVVIGNMYIGGCSLERHYNNSVSGKDDYSYRKIVNGVRTVTPKFTLDQSLADEKWDYITIQQSSGKSGFPDTYKPYLAKLLAYIDSKLDYDPVILFHMTWAYQGDSDHRDFPKYEKNQMKMYSQIVSSVKENVGENPTIKGVIPSGTAIQNARTSSLGDTFTRDGYHLKYGYGRFTAACTWFETISGKDVTKNSYRPENVSDSEAAICKMAAHKAVRKRWKITKIKL